MGVGNLFRKNSPDFSDFSTTNRLSFTDILHVAKFEVGEKGTKAAAATTTPCNKRGGFLRRVPLPFNCNRPFVFMIYDGERNLFSGIFRDPQWMIFEDWVLSTHLIMVIINECLIIRIKFKRCHLFLFWIYCLNVLKWFYFLKFLTYYQSNIWIKIDF